MVYSVSQPDESAEPKTERHAVVESLDQREARLDVERLAILKQLAEIDQDADLLENAPTTSPPPASPPPERPPQQVSPLPLQSKSTLPSQAQSHSQVPVPASGDLPPPPPSPPARPETHLAVRSATNATAPTTGKRTRAPRNSVLPKKPPTQDPDPLVRLNEVLLECEKEVREAKGYIHDPNDPVVKIVRVKRGTDTPKNATFLSHPKDTGVDFRIPVDVPGYHDFVEHPITLNQIRDRCRNRKYTRFEGYLDDMRLLFKNTADFNVEPQVQWVVQHGRLMLDAAIDAVEARKKALIVAESELSAKESSMSAIVRGANPGANNPKNTDNRSAQNNRIPTKKGKRDGALPKPSQYPEVGSHIQVFWLPDSQWYAASVLKYTSDDRIEVSFLVDGTTDLVRLDSNNWKPANGKPPQQKQSSRSTTTMPSKKKRKTTEAPEEEQPQGPAVTLFDLESIRSEMLNKVGQTRTDLVCQVRSLYGRLENISVDPPESTSGGPTPVVDELQSLICELKASQTREIRLLKQDFKELLK